MSGKELRQLLRRKDTVPIIFNENIELPTGRFEAGMKAYVFDVSYAIDKCYFIVRVYEGDFSDYNKSIEKPNRYDNWHGTHNLRYSDSGYSSGWRGKESIIESEDEVKTFSLIEDFDDDIAVA